MMIPPTIAITVVRTRYYRSATSTLSTLVGGRRSSLREGSPPKLGLSLELASSGHQNLLKGQLTLSPTISLQTPAGSDRSLNQARVTACRHQTWTLYAEHPLLPCSP